jgi:hypothetical protein
LHWASAESLRDEHLVVGTDLDADSYFHYFRAYTSLSTLIIPTGCPALAANSVRRRTSPSAKLRVYWSLTRIFLSATRTADIFR